MHIIYSKAKLCRVMGIIAQNTNEVDDKCNLAEVCSQKKFSYIWYPQDTLNLVGVLDISTYMVYLLYLYIDINSSCQVSVFW